MSLGVRYISQVFDKESNKVIEEKVLTEHNINLASDIDELGFRHKDQINLIERAQDVFLKYQCELFSDINTCPKCGGKLNKGGDFYSDFHDILTDHKVKLKRLTCTCGWYNKLSIKGLFGSASHPELLKKQLVTGCNNSYEKSSVILNSESGESRSINNSSTIRKQIKKYGAILSELKLNTSWAETDARANELIAETDGGHIQYIEKGRHSFEEMITTIFKPEDLKAVYYDKNKIENKICVGSALSDKQLTIKQLTLNAAQKMGMNKSTDIIALSDGAKNCWPVLEVLEPYCKSFTTVLDWFHVGKHFTSRESKIPEELREKYNKAKWHLWHGHPVSSLIRLEQVKAQTDDSKAHEVIDWLTNYINNNKTHIVDYHNRRLNDQIICSQTAETTVNNVINSRQKNQQMRWSRDGAHSVIQIRTSEYSRKWEEDWGLLKAEIYNKAA